MDIVLITAVVLLIGIVLIRLLKKRESEQAEDECEHGSDILDGFDDDISSLSPEDRAAVIMALGAKRILDDCMELIESTIHPKTFFSRYELAIEKAEEILKLFPYGDLAEDVAEILEDLTDNKTIYINDMLDRADERGRLNSIAGEVAECVDQMTDESVDYYNLLIDSTDE